MLFPAIRPHFDLEVPDPEHVLERLEAYLREHACDGGKEDCIRGWIHAPYGELAVASGQRHVWSPRLAVRLEQNDGPGDDERAVLHCRLQPEPGTWTMYMAGWAVLAVLTMLVIGFGCAQLMMNGTPTIALYGVPATLTAGTILYVSALLGQRLGEDQVDLLCDALRRAVED